MEIKTIFQHVEEIQAALVAFKTGVAEVKMNYECGFITEFEYLDQLTDVCLTAQKAINNGRELQDIQEAKVVVNYLAGVTIWQALAGVNLNK